MNIAALVFLVILIITTILTAIVTFIILVGGEDFPAGSIIAILCALIPTLIIWLLNLFSFPQKEARYVIDTKLEVHSNDMDSVGYTLDVPVDETIYFQVRVTATSNSFARRFFNDNRIPVTITISEPEIAQYTIHLLEGFEEIKPPETLNNATTYFFNVYANKPSKKEEAEVSKITLKGTAVKEGTQQIRVRYGKKVSGKYERVASLNFKERYRGWY
jgi:hypothetical protein